MPTLESFQGSSLVPDVSGGLNLLLGAFGTKQERTAAELEREKQAELQKQLDVLSGGIVEEQPEVPPVPGAIDERGAKGSTRKQQEAALVRLAGLNPQMANSIRQSLERGDKLELEEVKQATDKGTRQALLIQGQKDFAGKQRAITQAAQEASARGEDVTRFVELSNMSEPQLDLELQKMIIQGTDIKTLTDAALEPAEVVPAGGQIVKASEISDGFIVRQQPDGSFTKTKVLESAKTTDAGKASAVTKIFGDGTTVQALPSGKVVVKDPAGNVVEGEQRVAALASANANEISQAALKSSSQKAADAAIAQSTKTFERIGKLKTSITNIDKAIDAIDRGAKTGAIQSRLPSIRAASVELDNIQKAMGLDVIGNVTFGALSKGELDLALSKAMPTGLDEPALRRWLVDKKEAQEKLAAYVEDTAVFLGTPGNTIAGWLEAQEALTTIEPGAEAAGDVNTGTTTPEGFAIFQRADGSTYAVSAE
jgi:hypothetical protein